MLNRHSFFCMIELISNNRKVKLEKENGDILYISACKWSDLDILNTYIPELLKLLLKSNGFVGELLKPSNKEFWSIIKGICEILAVQKGETITVEDFLWSDNYPDVITKMFLTANSEISVQGDLSGKISPSYLTVINGIDFFTMSKTVMTEESNKAVPK